MSDPNLSPRQTVALWQATTRMPTFPPLLADVAADVCIVGAGIAGLTAAYTLSRAGRRVVVLEAREPGDGNTGRTTAHLASALDDRWSEVVRIHGREVAALAWRAHAAAIDAIADIVATESIDCAFERLDGYLFLAPGHTVDRLDDELAACRDIGFAAVERAAYAPLGGFDTGPALRFPGQAQFHPLDYLAGLARAVVRAGGQIHGNTRAARIVGGDEPRVETADGRTVRASAVIQATNVPVHANQGVHPRQAPYMTYAIALRIPAGAVPRGLYWDTADPYHYVRVHPIDDGELLIVGGEDHKAG